MGSLGWPEIIAILVIVLVIFGPKRLPEIGKSLGKGIKEFKKSTTELQEHITKDEPETPKVEKAEAVEAAGEPVTAPEPKAAPEPEPAPAPEPKSPETKTS
ncbi:MAG: twin-arginine translocase TatA/TatE family subunit [Actinobacteria bacterium]|nr:twin-arginine translocase TatA/TatE family subunit [Actinomycetota bacterium]